MSYCDEAQTQAHHFVIAAATGPTSPGRCTHCGEAKDFQNWVPGLDWGKSADVRFNKEQQRQRRLAQQETIYPDGELEQL